MESQLLSGTESSAATARRRASADDWARWSDAVYYATIRRWMSDEAGRRIASQASGKNRNTLFDDDRPDEPLFRDIRFTFENFSAVVAAEKEQMGVLGFSLSQDILWLYGPAMRVLGASGVGAVYRRRAGEELTIGGVSTKIQAKMTKGDNGRPPSLYLKFSINGSENNVPCIAWSEAASADRWKAVENSVVVARGYAKSETKKQDLYNEEYDLPDEEEYRTFIARQVDVVSEEMAFQEAAKFFGDPPPEILAALKKNQEDIFVL